MTQSMDYTATLKTKRCKNTGMTEDIIRQLHGRPGARVMAIVELKVDDAHHKDDAPNHVDFTVEQIQPFTDDDQAEFLRKMCRSAHQRQVLNSEDGQLTIDGQDDLEPSVDDLMAQQQAAIDSELADHPHEFIGDRTGDCELCQAPFGNPIHIDEPAGATADPDKEPVPAGT